MKNLRYILILFAIWLVAALTLGCSPEKRIARILKRNPHLVKTDTVWVKDTVTVYGTHTDTIIKIWQKDTVIIRKDQLTMKYFVRSDSTIYLDGKCDTVRIIREIPVATTTVKVEEAPTLKQRILTFLWDNTLLILILAGIAVLFFRLKNRET